MTDRARKRRDAWRKTNKLNVTFNTHKAAKALKSSGFDEKQAEAVVETIDKAVNETVATKADLAILGADLEVQGVKIEALRETVEGIKENIAKNVATKADLAILGADLEVQGAKIEALRETVEGIKENIAKNVATKADLKAQGVDIANLETRMMRMMWLQLMVMVSMFVTVVVTLL